MGEMCEGCGDYLGDEAGFARLCPGCAQDRADAGQKVRPTGLGGFQAVRERRALSNVSNKTECPACKKRVKKAGLANHMRDAHGVKR